MIKKKRSARGVMVDFDLLQIKSDIASAPKPHDVKVREDFIESRLRRRVRKKVTETVVESTEKKIVTKAKAKVKPKPTEESNTE